MRDLTLGDLRLFEAVTQKFVKYQTRETARALCTLLYAFKTLKCFEYYRFNFHNKACFESVPYRLGRFNNVAVLTTV